MYHVAITRSLANPDGTTIFGDLGVDRLEAEGITWEVQADAVDELSATLAALESSRVILVSNEVGLGIVPDNPLARTFRDLAGSTHQRIAEICDDVYFVVAGLPLTLKGAPPDKN